MFKECLEDVTRVLSAKYPAHLKGKLLSRKTECMTILENWPLDEALQKLELNDKDVGKVREKLSKAKSFKEEKEMKPAW